MLVFAAIGVFGAGMLAIAAGIPIKEFGFGNTLILSGVLAWCTAAIMLTLWVCFRDLKQGIVRPNVRPVEQPASPPAETRPSAPPLAPPANSAGWPESIPERAPSPPPPLPSAPPPPEPRRNLLFASNRRPPRDTPPAATESPMTPAPSASPLDLRPATTDDARPAPRRIDQPPPRTVRPVSTVGPRDPVSAPPLPPAPPPPSPAAEPSPPAEPDPARGNASPGRSESSAVSVLKSGVVDGMAYWLYSDGSIEAQMPEGMMRFTSIDELRAHLDKRP